MMHKEQEKHQEINKVERDVIKPLLEFILDKMDYKNTLITKLDEPRTRANSIENRGINLSFALLYERRYLHELNNLKTLKESN